MCWHYRKRRPQLFDSTFHRLKQGKGGRISDQDESPADADEAYFKLHQSTVIQRHDC